MTPHAARTADLRGGPTTRTLIDDQVAHRPSADAIAAPSGVLTYAALGRQRDETAGRLAHLGIGRGDCVAVALPNGPEMATAFLCVASAATCAPLNPAYTGPEFEFYLRDLQAKVVIVATGDESPARAAAGALGVGVIELTPEGGGRFRLDGPAAPAVEPRDPGPDDIALVLHTSGTTARPKIITLTHANVCASASNVAAALELTATDRCLNVMPLFHIHGLIGVLLSSISAGASVVCTAGFSSSQFGAWLRRYRPSWYSAVPTIHQEVLARAPKGRASSSLRFIRSSSAALSPIVKADLERAFGVPVVEAYGMTEAAHQIASNPLPPRPRKPGSVGLPAGPDVAILDDAGQPVPAGERGEIAIRGDNVSALALARSSGAAATRDAWFRTGDTGYLDGDGYLFIAGRLKEMINRAGEKISPREIDEVLLDHPAVAQAVACAVPDERLGEDIAAVVVRRPGATVTERDLRAFASTRLAAFKVPRRVLFVDRIPKGPTGKIQRIGLAERLGIDSLTFATPDACESVPPRTEAEKALAAIWTRALGIDLDRVGLHDNFFELGGDSLRSVEVSLAVERRFGVALDERQLAYGTLQQLAASCAVAPPPAKRSWVSFAGRAFGGQWRRAES